MKETARSIADGAMMEAASICVGKMVKYYRMVIFLEANCMFSFEDLSGPKVY